MSVLERLHDHEIAVIVKLKTEQICMNKIAATRDETALDPAGADYFTAAIKIRRIYREKVGYDCPMCDGRKVFCKKYIGVNPEAYRHQEIPSILES